MNELNHSNVERRGKALLMLTALLLLFIVPSIASGRPPVRTDLEQQTYGTGDPIGGDKQPVDPRTIRIIPEIVIETQLGDDAIIVPGSGSGEDSGSQSDASQGGSNWNLRYWLNWIAMRFAGGRF